MATNPTKILLYDLDPDLGKLMDDLKLFQGTHPRLYDRLIKLDVSLFSGDTKLVVQDLIDALNNDGKGSAASRLKTLETENTNRKTDIQSNVDRITGAETSIQNNVNRIAEVEASISDVNLEQLEAGNFNETFAYDSLGNVTTHSVTGDRAYTVTYNYKTDNSGELTTSVKQFTDGDGNVVKITKAYSYVSGDITGISTSTTITAPTA